MSRTLHRSFLTRPIAHRGLHDVQKGRPENSLSAFRAAVEAGYGIELDVQLTADNEAVVFHDYDLSRLTEATGAVRQQSLAQMQALPLRHGAGEAAPSLGAVLDMVNAKVPVLVELKDQDGGMGPKVGPLEVAVAKALQRYGGAVAVMSFNPHSMIAMSRRAPRIVRGLVTEAYAPEDWPLPAATCDRLREIPDFEAVGAAFISHQAEDLDRPRVAQIKARRVPVLCWTIRSEEEEARARRVADNVTFEGYLPGLGT